MKFWSDVEKEYNELFGDDKNESKQEDPDENAMESDFNNMFTEMRKDFKKVPKDDLIPGISSPPEASGSEDEDGEFDDGDAKKSMKIGEAKKKRNKKCKVGDKTYEVGERWKDPKTGKDMICILMNIPKDVQPKLAEADVIITKEEEKPEEPEIKPAKYGQWAYTNKVPKGRMCPSDKESEKPDQAGSDDDKDSLPEKQSEDFSTEIIPAGEKEAEILDNDTPEEQTAEEAGISTEASGKDSDTRESLEKDSDENSEDKPSEKETESERLGEKGDSDEGEGSESDTDSDEERRKAEKEMQNDDDSEYEEREEDVLKNKADRKNSEFNVTKEDRETAVVETETEKPERHASTSKKRAEEKHETEKKEDVKKEVSEKSVGDSLKKPTPTEDIPQKEKGKTIYTKETTVTQKKLLKTSETIESVETEKNVV